MPRNPPQRTVAFVTYTFANPWAVGVLFRSLRLALELHRRGWRFVFFNLGPFPNDPKMDRAREVGGEFRHIGASGEEPTGEMVALLRSARPDLVVFGEEPFPGMLKFYEGARMGRAPLVVLDQFYHPKYPWPHPGIDL